MVRIGVLGAGHLGKKHLKLIQDIQELELAGFYDPDGQAASEAEETFQVTRYASVEDLIADVDAVDIVTPTLSHYDMAVLALKKGKHLFIEKPLTRNLEEAEDLLQLTAEAGVKVQVGHIERFNPALLAAQQHELKPLFIDAHRLATFNPRGTDVAVIYDLMIHDLDIVLSLVTSPIKRISASGVSVISETPDIANARIEFHNGTVANLTSSRISLKQMRKMRMFQQNAYISVDFLDKKTEVFNLLDQPSQDKPEQQIELETGDNKPNKYIIFDQPTVEEHNALQNELRAFANSILNNAEPPVTVEDGYYALDIADRITWHIQKNNLAEAINSES
jgi:predicted dehydrogenase